ncbi:MAG: M48 family metalloprotease, partial [Proteobacteria bacterium]|nr:M48 family metalloprotease [Pseudomonadota bacterium]
AVSRGLIENLSAEELEAILVRELCQLASGDTRVIALMQGMCFAFTLYVARMLSFLLGTSLRTSEDDASSSSDSMELLLMIGLTLLLTLPGALLLSRFSRSSALRADRQAALKGQVPALLAAFHILKGSRLEQIRREPFSDGAKLLNRPLPSWFPTWFTQADLGHRLKELSKLNTGRS